jgi:hypothetical protein
MDILEKASESMQYAETSKVFSRLHHLASGLLSYKAGGSQMESMFEIIRHTAHLKPVAQLELFSYISLVSLTVLLGVVNCLLRRD